MGSDSDERGGPPDVMAVLAAIGERNLLKSKREVETAQGVRAGEEARRRLDEGPVPSRAEEEELERLVFLGRVAEVEFCQLHEGLVTSVAKRYAGRGLSPVELMQAGKAGLIHALLTKDWGGTYEWFPGYAKGCIQRALFRAIEDRSPTTQPTGAEGWSPGQDVPGWNQRLPSLDDATPDQAAFYRWMVDEIRAGRTPDLQWNLSYLFLFIYEAVYQFLRDRDYLTLAGTFEFLRCGYGDTVARRYLDTWQADAAVLVGDWEEAWTWRCRAATSNSSRLSVRDVVNIRRRCRDTSLDAGVLFSLVGSDTRLTGYGTRHRAEIVEIIVRLLAERHQTAGANLVDDFCTRYEGTLNGASFAVMADEVNYLVSPAKLARLHRGFTPAQSVQRSLNLPTPIAETPGGYDHLDYQGRSHVAPPTEEVVPVSPAVEAGAVALCQSVLREAEDVLRTREGLPAVGEGWVSETELYQLVRRSFPETRVVQHARPPWLTPQHLDVYLPEHNVGIEYQGAQHIEPVDYFGGEEALRQVQARDRRKLNLCRRHGCKLIYVYQGYNPDEVLGQVRAAVSRQAAKRGGGP